MKCARSATSIALRHHFAKQLELRSGRDGRVLGSPHSPSAGATQSPGKKDDLRLEGGGRGKVGVGRVFGRVIGQVRERGDVSPVAALQGDGALRPTVNRCQPLVGFTLGEGLPERTGLESRLVGGNSSRREETKQRACQTVFAKFRPMRLRATTHCKDGVIGD